MKYRLQASRLRPVLEELEQRRWLFANLPIDPTHAEWLRRRACVRTIHGTTRIEGNTPSDVKVEVLHASAAGSVGSAVVSSQARRSSSSM